MLLLVLFVGVAVGTCSHNDRQIYHEIGAQFPSLFRALGGLFVSQDAYEESIVTTYKLSPVCARCYGNAYTCGWDNCKMACTSAGTTCDVCLVSHECIQKCNQCTGFTN